MRGASMCLSAPRVDSVLCLFLCVCVLSVWFGIASLKPWTNFGPFPAQEQEVPAQGRSFEFCNLNLPRPSFMGLADLISSYIHCPYHEGLTGAGTFSSLFPPACLSFFCFFLSLLLLLVPLHLTADMQTPHPISLKNSHNKSHLHTFIKVVI